MKKTMMILGMLFLTTFVSAQEQRPDRKERPSPEQILKKATKELSLTDDQVKQWKAIHEKYSEDMEDRSKSDATRKKMGEELEATLTKEQLDKFKKMRPGKRRPKDGN